MILISMTIRVHIDTYEIQYNTSSVILKNEITVSGRRKMLVSLSNKDHFTTYRFVWLIFSW